MNTKKGKELNKIIKKYNLYCRGIFTTLILAIVLLSGCVTTQIQKFMVNVDSIIDSSITSKKTYIILPGNKDTSINDLQFKEYATYINRALIKHELFPAESFEKANVVIFLSYGIGDPQEHQFSYSIPVWGQTGVSSSTTYGNINTLGSFNTYGNYGTYQGNTSSSSTTTYTPSYGIKGYTSHIGTYTTYFRFILLDAYDLDKYKNSKKEIQLWKTTVTSNGRSPDLRRVFPILVAASKNYIGTNTGKKIQVVIQENDKSVIEIKGVGQVKLREEQVDRLKSFLFLYCKTYESKDIDKFTTFFAHDALENDKPFYELLSEYRRNMEMIESVSYRIELVDYYLQTDTGRVNIQGKIFARYLLHGEALKENTGNISMELIESGDSYLVKRLNYTSQSSKKVGEQPQWSPWIETGNKK